MSSLEPKVFNLCDLYSRAVQQTPHHVAVEHEEGTLTYLELDSASCALASHLADLGVGHTSKVPLLTSLGTLNIVAILGILKTGACYVPLDRTTWSKDRIDQVMNLIDSPVVVNTTAEPFSAGTWHEVHLRDAAILQALQANKRSYSRTSQISGDDLACIIFTSGSTGKPKGVMIRHQSVANYAQTSPFNMDVKPGDRVLHILSVAFDASTGMLFSILGNSGAVIPASIDTLHEKAVTCTILASTPSILATLFLPSSTINPYKLVHTILLGGETPPQSLLAAWLAQSVRILNAYGPTETMCASLMQEVEVCQRTYSVRNAIIGLPMPQCPAYVVDPATMEVFDDDDVEGEIIIAGCSLAHGYYNDLAKTSTAFVDWNGVRVYRTGDLGRWVRRNDGARVMEFRGRSDRTVKNRGFLVNLDSDVEGPIAQMREFGVDSVCAAMVQGHLVAVITPLCVDVSALYQKLRSTLSAFHVPDRIHAVDELPLSANGKVDMKAVLALLRPNHANTDGLNDSRQSGDMNVNSNYSRTARIAQCMKEALGLDQQHCLTGDSDFFELGGNSLAALRFTTLCRSQGLKVMPKDVYSAKTVIAITACANENDNVIVDVGEAALQHAGIRQAQADMLVTIAQAIGIAPSDIEAAGSLTTLQLELASSTMECDGKNTVQVRRVYDGTRAATMRSAWHSVCESEPLFRTELALHLPCGPVQILRSQARECLQPVLRVFDDYEAYHTAISQVGLVVGLGQRIEMLSYQPARKSVEGVEDWSQAADEDMDDNTELEMTVIWTIHHALIDGYSQALVLAQVERAARGEVLVPGRSFIDAAAALTVIQEARDEEARAFWWSHLEDVVVGTPGVRPIGVDQTDTRADAPSVRATELAFTMPEHEASRIAPFARAHRTTVATLHYTAWALAQISLFQSRIVVVGAVVSGRETQPLFENVIGPTMATLPLVVRLPQDGAPSAKELLESTMGSLVSMADYAWSRPDQITRSWRLSNLLAEQYGFPVHDTEVPQARPAELFDNTAFPLNLLADGDATFRLVFDTKIHSIAAASRVRDGFIRALKALLRDDIAVCLPDSQRGVRQADGIPRSLQHVLERFANGPPKTVRMAFERSAIENADLVAVESTTASLTYAELNLRAGQVACDIRQRMPHARVVSIHADGSLNWVVGILAILKAGCAYCPLDPAYTLERRAVIHKQSGAAGLLLPYRNQSHEVPLPDLNTVIVIDEANAQTMQGAEHGVLLDEVDDSPQSDALIVFTSGTTGEPKGVPISNQGLLALQSNREATMFSQPGRRIAQFMSPAFDYCANEILSALLHGGTLVLKDPTDSLAHLKRVDAATFTPSMMAIMDPDDYPNLRIVYATGEPIAPTLVNRWAPGRLFYNAYGPAECSICTSFTRLRPGAAVTIGRPIRTARMYVLDANLQPIVEPGVVGEIFLAGMQVMRGYINAPEKSALCVSVDPWHTGERMYRTGDYGTFTANGCISYIGRVDRQIKLRGFRIELAAIEQKMYQVDPSILLATVLVKSDILVAFVKPATVNVDRLRRLLKKALQPSWIPQTIIAIDDMPMTANRKVDSRALESMTIHAKRNPVQVSDGEDILKDALETSIAREWKVVLRLDRNNEPSACEDFLSLGGHSVLQMLLSVRLSKAFGVAVTTGDIIRSPTIRSQANIIRGRAKSTQQELRPLANNALSPLEEQAWYSYRAATSSTTFNIAVLLHLSGYFDRHKLVSAMNEVLESRKILRSNFASYDSGPRRILRPASPRVHQVDELDVHREVNIAFDLERDELIRVFFARKSDTLLIVSSHAITDLNSIQSLLREVSSVYAAPGMTRPRMHYLRAPVWSRPVQDKDKMFWFDYLRNMPPRLDALLRLPAPSLEHVFEGTSRFHSFSGPLLQQCIKLLPLYGVTHHHFAITIVAQALQWLSGTNDVILGCPFQNRFGDLEQESAGLFLDRLPIRIQTSSATTSTKDLLRATRDASQQAIAAAIPFRDILSALKMEGTDPFSPSSHPIFQAMVTFHLENAVESCLTLPGCTVRRARPADCWARGAKFLCMFEWTEMSADVWVLRIEYDSSRIGREIIERIERTIKSVMEGIANEESRKEIFKVLAERSGATV